MATEAAMRNAGDSKESSWIEGSNLFRQWNSIKEDILRHKWYESEKAGYDIGWEKASVDWMVRFGCRR